MDSNLEDNYINLEKAAEYLNIKPVTKDLPAHQIGKLWRFKKSELDEWIHSGNSAAKR